MRETFLPFSPPLIGEEEIEEVIDTLRSDWITTGPKVKRFEAEFADRIGSPSALAVSSATDALLVGLAALGVQRGDEVITTPMTFCSTVHVIEHLGAIPVMVDVEPDNLTIDPELIMDAVGPKTRGILPVHIYGHPCAMDEIAGIARQWDLFVLEDAAHSLPATYKNKAIGSIGDLTAFSFYATKNLTTGEGGMLTGETELIDQARVWSLHGMTRDAYKRHSAEGSWRYEVVLPGFKCNMTDIQASIGLHQLRKLDLFHEKRKNIVSIYDRGLSGIDEIQTLVELPEVESSWHIYPIRLNLDMLMIDRDRFIEEMRTRNIGTSVHFIPIHIHPYYRDKYSYKADAFPVAYENYLRLVTLPLNLRMSDTDAFDVIEAVSDIVKKYRR
ncbi:MAG: DegT/DnrJ/EryC1/StrS family aminotransferase [Actinobacteria bacterium]|nr:DegT/DnrJ/EryC1/StrS family aminotransferase [Actinomycetota bacterium]